MTLVAIFLRGVAVGLGISTAVTTYENYKLAAEAIESEYEATKAATSAKYAELRSQIKVGGAGNIQEDKSSNAANSQMQVGGTGNRQSID